MKEEALALVENIQHPYHKLNLLREYLQAFVLRSLHESEAFTKIAFVGGTALRFLENLPRFSEDLDFSLINSEGYDPKTWLTKIRRDLEFAGFDCSVSLNTKKVVNVSWIRVSNLLQHAELSNRAEQKLSIKLEIDTKPPAGAEIEKTLIVKHLTFALSHYRLSSLMAGKIHALISRNYPKGRDWFDLLWYQGHRPPIEPNLDLLQNALDQSQGVKTYDAQTWRFLILEKLNKEDIKTLRKDVQPFLEREADRNLITKENFEAVLK